MFGIKMETNIVPGLRKTLTLANEAPEEEIKGDFEKRG